MPPVIRRIVGTTELSSAAKIKRMSSNKMNTNSAGDVVVLGYTSTAIVVTAVKLYTVAAIQGAAFVLDVGTNGAKEAIVANEAIGITGADTVVNCIIDTPNVAAGTMIIASVSTPDGTGGNVVVAIECYEDE